jgi:hypothetical protein
LPPGTLTWHGMTEGIPAVKQSLSGLTDGVGREPVFTWLLRADEQVRQVHGDFAWVANTHGALLRALQRGGDELGWHPHFWRRETTAGPWFQETADVPWQLSMLHDAHAALAKALPSPVRSVRMGWNYHNNETFAALDKLGISVEFSAVPGMRTFHGRPPVRAENSFDWQATPRRPFYPSRADYRREPRGAERPFGLLELPNFVSTSHVWAMMSGVQLARKSRQLVPLVDALRRPTYWINITARTRLFAPLVQAMGAALRRGTDAPLAFATYFHPDELLPNRSSLYSLRHVRTNLELLLRTCAAAGWAVEFLQASQFADRWRAANPPDQA